MGKGLFKALNAVNNNQSELARRCGIKPQSVQDWVENGEIPAGRVLQVEKVTGVHRSILRPDYYPPEQDAA